MEEEEEEQEEQKKDEEVLECELIHLCAHINVNFIHYRKTIYTALLSYKGNCFKRIRVILCLKKCLCTPLTEPTPRPANISLR